MRLATDTRDVARGEIVLIPCRVNAPYMKWDILNRDGEPTGIMISPMSLGPDAIAVTPAELAGLFEVARSGATATPPNDRLRELAAQSPPPARWLEGEEENLFDPDAQQGGED